MLVVNRVLLSEARGGADAVSHFTFPLGNPIVLHATMREVMT
jgi:hypothetical protein